MRSQELNKELLDLVNENYQDFLGLGSSLTGGDEKVEEVRLGLLSFRREVDGLREMVTVRKQSIEQLLAERRRIADEIRVGKLLLELEAQLEDLESSLRITTDDRTALSDGDELEISDSADSDEDSSRGTIAVAMLRRRAHQLVAVKRLWSKLNAAHPFLQLQEPRLQKIRETLLLDLKTALVDISKPGAKSSNGHVKILALYRMLEEPAAALLVVKDHSQKSK